MEHQVTSLSGLFFSDRTKPERRVIGYLPACYPDDELYRMALRKLYCSGIRIMEIGIPGGIGELEGGTISKALSAVKQGGLDPETAIRTGTRLAADAGFLPIVMAFRTAVVEQVGLDFFVKIAAENGAKALLVPDLYPDEMDYLVKSADHHQMPVVQFVAATGTLPTSLPDTAFLYLQTADMPTGGVFAPDENLRGRIEALHERFPRLPVALGFGIRTPQQVTSAFEIGADLVVIGTAMVDALNRSVDDLGSYADEIVAAAGGDK